MTTRTWMACFVSGAILLGSAGCEIIASIDRSLIEGTGGAGGTGGSTSSSTGGSGGQGGMTASSSGPSGGGGAGGSECTQASDCGSTECIDYTCTAGKCGQMPTAEGTLVGAQTAGDCKKRQCDGAGNAQVVADDGDLPNDSNDCTDDVCQNGTPSNPPKSAGQACGAMQTLFCDGAGQCVGCLFPTDCSGMDTECQQRSCTAGVCGVTNTPQGTSLAVQTTGDCQVAQCDGNGGTQSADDNGDLPVDGLECTSDLCANGVPSNPDIAAGQSCSQNGGTLCDGSGACVECLGAADCPGVDNDCQARTCSAGKCGIGFTANGTAVSVQVSGDCKKDICDGAGNTVSINDDTDLPVDSNNCTSDVCTAGVPSNPAVMDGTMCGTGLACVGGSCSGCVAPSDCPGVDDECKSRTCNVGVCGFSFTANGTAVAAQTAGNCQKNVCDGAGNVQSVADNADVPVDNNQCTSDVCTNGAPSNPLLPSNTACNQNGGSVCSATGQCVQCNLAAQCAGMDTDCKVRTCSANVCGTSNVQAGTPTSIQTPGDCQVNQCDGAGNSVSVASNGDVPADDGQECTSEVCNNGVPQHPPKGINTGCTQNGGSFCNGAGACVQCNNAGQCPGMDTDCQTRSCAANSCGFTFALPGTPTSSQVSGDCKENQCNGTGGVVVANNDLDVPADDGNQCTSEVCTAGTPSHPAKPANVACSQNGGNYCDGSGSCVECNLGSQCASLVCNPGTHTCSAPTCNDGVKNGTETDTDCGGTCMGCGPGLGCMLDADCSGGACNPTTHTCAPTCVSDPTALGATCTSYCTCMTATCAGKFPSMAACITACETFVEPQLCCRAYHCGAAMGDPVTHCPHAAGEAICP